MPKDRMVNAVAAPCVHPNILGGMEAHAYQPLPPFFFVFGYKLRIECPIRIGVVFWFPVIFNAQVKGHIRLGVRHEFHGAGVAELKVPIPVIPLHVTRKRTNPGLKIVKLRMCERLTQRNADRRSAHNVLSLLNVRQKGAEHLELRRLC